MERAEEILHEIRDMRQSLERRVHAVEINVSLLQQRDEDLLKPLVGAVASHGSELSEIRGAVRFGRWLLGLGIPGGGAAGGVLFWLLQHFI